MPYLIVWWDEKYGFGFKTTDNLNEANNYQLGFYGAVYYRENGRNAQRIR